MTNKHWNKVKDGKDVTRLLERKGHTVVKGRGSHCKCPKIGLVYYNHGEFPKGIRHKIIKALVAAGALTSVLVALVVSGGMV